MRDIDYESRPQYDGIRNVPQGGSLCHVTFPTPQRNSTSRFFDRGAFQICMDEDCIQIKIMQM